MAPEQFRHVLLSHDHADHMLGLPLIQLVHSRANPEGPPLEVHSGPSTLDNVRLLCRVSTPELSINAEGATNRRGHKVYQWHPSVAGQSAQLGPNTKAACFSGRPHPRVHRLARDCDGIPVVFSGDTVFSPSLVEAARGARVLIHEAFGTEEDRGRADEAAHSVAGDVGKAARQADVEELILTPPGPAGTTKIPSPWWTRSRRYLQRPGLRGP